MAEDASHTPAVFSGIQPSGGLNAWGHYLGAG